MARSDSFNTKWASAPAQFEKPEDSLIQRGWAGGASEDPPEAKWENWWHNRVDEALAEIEANGAPKWFADVAYKVGATVHSGDQNWIAAIASEGIEPGSVADEGHWVRVGVGSASTFDSIASLINTSPKTDSIYIKSYYPGWAATVAGPKGGHYRHKTGFTNEAPSTGAAVAVSTVGTGSRADLCWDASGAEWKITLDGHRYNILWFHDGSDDPAAAIQAAVDVAVASENEGPIGREIYFPSNPNGGTWLWGSTQVSFEDVNGVKEASLTLVTDHPTYIKCTASLDSLFRTGYYEKSRKQSISWLHVDVNGQTLTAIVQRGQSLYPYDHHIEVSDGPGTGTLTHVIQCDDGLSNEGVGSGSGFPNGHFHDIWDSGADVVTNSMVYANKMTSTVIERIRAAQNATYGVELVSSAGAIQGNHVTEIYAEPGSAANTALVRLEEAGSTISLNKVGGLVGHLLSTYGVSLAHAAGVIQDNEFEVNEAGFATSAFDQKDDLANIRRNTYNGWSYNNGDPSSAGVWNGRTRDNVRVWDTTGDEGYIYTNSAWRRLSPPRGDVFELTIADDAAASVTPFRNTGIAEIATAGFVQYSGLVSYDSGASSAMAGLALAADVDVTTGALSGTTGVDTKLTVSSHTDGKIYIENRTGATRTVYVRVRG